MSSAVGRRAIWIFGATVFFTLYVSLLVYPAARILHLLLPEQPFAMGLATTFCTPILIRIWVELAPSRFTRALSRISLTFLGVCFVAWTPVVLFELINLAVPLNPTAAGTALLTIVALLSAYACFNALHIRLERVHIHAPAALNGKVIAQVSDLHIGSLHPRQLKRVVRLLNKAEPDYVALTGDIVDFKEIPAEALAPLRDLTAPAYFIIGNHERYVDVDDICARIEGHGVTVLRNSSVIDGPLQFIGIDDAERKDQVARKLPELHPAADKFRVLLYHRPDGAEDAAAWGAHLMLAGHTHNGQIVPFNFLVQRYFPRIAGLHQVGACQLHVSTGTGVWGPVLRLGSTSSITLLHLG